MRYCTTHGIPDMPKLGHGHGWIRCHNPLNRIEAKTVHGEGNQSSKRFTDNHDSTVSKNSRDCISNVFREAFDRHICNSLTSSMARQINENYIKFWITELDPVK